MATCEVCGNDYWMAFEVRTVSGDVHTFDSLRVRASQARADLRALPGEDRRARGGGLRSLLLLRALRPHGRRRPGRRDPRRGRRPHLEVGDALTSALLDLNAA